MDLIQRRIRKDIRQNRLLEKGDRILIIDDGSKKAAIGADLLREVIGGLPVKLDVRKHSYTIGQQVKGEYNKIVIPWTMDDECSYFLECLMNGKKPKLVGHFRKRDKLYIKLLMEATNLELGIEEEGEVQNLLDSLEKFHPETKFSMLQSIKSLKTKKII